MRLIVMGMVCLTLAHCGPKSPKVTPREREPFAPESYEALKQLNTILVENEEAIAGTVEVTRSEKSRKMSQALKDARCGFTRNEARREAFDTDWSASQVFGGNGCPVRSQRDWRYGNRNRELIVYHTFATLDPEFRKVNGINKLDGSGSILVTRDDNGAQKITGEIRYDRFEIEGVGALQAVVRTTQQYKGAGGGGTVTVTVTQKGVFSFTGGIRWEARDFKTRSYFVGKTAIERKNFNELFSFFELDKVVDDSERMR